jgi:hypothetical protein
VLLSLLGHIILDVEVRLGVFLEFVERESVLDDADLSPLVLLGSKDLLDLFLVIGPLGQLAI